MRILLILVLERNAMCCLRDLCGFRCMETGLNLNLNTQRCTEDCTRLSQTYTEQIGFPLHLNEGHKHDCCFRGWDSGDFKLTIDSVYRC